jgi:hypothetical protein
VFVSFLMIIVLGVSVWIASCLFVVAVCASAKEGDDDAPAPAPVPVQHLDALS